MSLKATGKMENSVEDDASIEETGPLTGKFIDFWMLPHALKQKPVASPTIICNPLVFHEDLIKALGRHQLPVGVV